MAKINGNGMQKAKAEARAMAGVMEIPMAVPEPRNGENEQWRGHMGGDRGGEKRPGRK